MKKYYLSLLVTLFFVSCSTSSTNPHNSTLNTTSVSNNTTTTNNTSSSAINNSSSTTSSSQSTTNTNSSTSSSSIEEHTHEYSTKWSYDETYHYHSPLCSDITEVIDKAEHKFVETITKEAENDQDGLKELVCSICGYTKEETIPYVPSSPKAINKNLNKEYDSITNSIKYANNDNAIVIYPALDASIDEELTIKSSVNVYLPFKEELILERGTTKSTNDLSLFTNTSKLTLNADLIIEGSLTIGGTINSSSHPYQGFIQGDYSSLDLNGHNITIQNGGSLKSNGLIYDSSSNKGSIFIKENSILSTSFAVEDFRGGTNSLNKYNNGESPFMLYKLPYLQVNTKVEYNATLAADCVLYALDQHNTVSETIIGKGGLLEITEENGYIIREFDDSNGYKATIQIHGNTTNNGMSILTVSTANVFFPVSKYLNIDIYDDSILTVQNKIKVLPGSSVTLHDDSKIVLNGQVNLYETFKPQSDFASYQNYNFYPDYGTYDAAKLVFLDNSDITINPNNVDNKNILLGGNIFVNSSKESKIKSTLLDTNKYYSEIKTSESIAYPTYNLLYEQEENVNVYSLINNAYVITNKIFKNFSFSYNYDSNSNLDLILMQNTDGSFIGYKDYTDETPQWKVKIKGDLTTTSFTSETLSAIISDNSKTYIFYNGNYVEGNVNENNIYVIDNENYIDYDGFYVKVTELENKIYYDKDNIHYVYVNNKWQKISNTYFSNKLIEFILNDKGYEYSTYFFYKNDNTWVSCSYSDYDYISYYDKNLKTSLYYIYYNGDFVSLQYDLCNFSDQYVSDGTNYYLRTNGVWDIVDESKQNRNEKIFNYYGDTYIHIGSDEYLLKVKEIKVVNGFKYAILENPVTRQVKYNYVDDSGNHTPGKINPINVEYKIAIQTHDYKGEDQYKWSYASFYTNHYDGYDNYYEGSYLFTFDSSGRELPSIPVKSINRNYFTNCQSFVANDVNENGSIYYKSDAAIGEYKLGTKTTETIKLDGIDQDISVYDVTNSKIYFTNNNEYIAGEILRTSEYNNFYKSEDGTLYGITGSLSTSIGYIGYISSNSALSLNETSIKGLYKSQTQFTSSNKSYTIYMGIVDKNENGYYTSVFFAVNESTISDDVSSFYNSSTHVFTYGSTASYISYNGYLVKGTYDSTTSKFISTNDNVTYSYDDINSSWTKE